MAPRSVRAAVALATMIALLGAPARATRADDAGDGSGSRRTSGAIASGTAGQATRPQGGGGVGSVASAALSPRPELPHPEVPSLGRVIPVPPVSSEHRALAIASGETLAIHLTMMGWNRWVGDASWANVSADSIGRNLRSGWVRDDDDFWVNQFGHPYQGTWSYGAARSAGLGFWGSTAFPVAQSVLWELTGETTAPSINDQVTTSVAGIVLGEAFWRFSEALRADGGPAAQVLAAMLVPMAPLNRRLLPGAAAQAVPSTRWTLALGGLAGDAPRAGWPGTGAPPRAYAGLDLTWGLPGDPDLVLDDPFDHFVLEASYAAASDPVATVRGRGLLAGARLEAGDDVRGLWGLFLSFDFDTTGPYRVSTSAVGVGASGRAALGGRLALEGTAVASAVLMGGAGDVARPADGTGRDYRLGPGEQALLDVRLRADPRVSGGVTLRQVLLVGGDGPGAGPELVVEASAGILLRIAGPHAIGADAARHLRRGHDASGALAEQGGTSLRVYYALAGGG